MTMIAKIAVGQNTGSRNLDLSNISPPVRLDQLPLHIFERIISTLVHTSGKRTIESCALLNKNCKNLTVNSIQRRLYTQTQKFVSDLSAALSRTLDRNEYLCHELKKDRVRRSNYLATTHVDVVERKNVSKTIETGFNKTNLLNLIEIKLIQDIKVSLNNLCNYPMFFNRTTLSQLKACPIQIATEIGFILRPFGGQLREKLGLNHVPSLFFEDIYAQLERYRLIDKWIGRTDELVYPPRQEMAFQRVFNFIIFTFLDSGDVDIAIELANRSSYGQLELFAKICRHLVKENDNVDWALELVDKFSDTDEEPALFFPICDQLILEGRADQAVELANKPRYSHLKWSALSTICLSLLKWGETSQAIKIVNESNNNALKTEIFYSMSTGAIRWDINLAIYYAEKMPQSEWKSRAFENIVDHLLSNNDFDRAKEILNSLGNNNNEANYIDK